MPDEYSSERNEGDLIGVVHFSLVAEYSGIVGGNARPIKNPWEPRARRLQFVRVSSRRGS